MTITFCYTTNVSIEYDATFRQELGHVDLDHVKDTILFMFSEYNFTQAVAVDNDTGEILMEVDADDYVDDDDDYDDCDTDE